MSLTAEQRAALARLGDGEASSDDVRALLADLAAVEAEGFDMAARVLLLDGCATKLVNVQAERDRLAARVAALEARLDTMRHSFAISSTDEERRLTARVAALEAVLHASGHWWNGKRCWCESRCVDLPHCLSARALLAGPA
jgi:BMFP domain-containing protein YqiC